MGRRWWMVVPMLLLGGCEAQLCALLGAFAGSFDGDASGTLDALVAGTDDPEKADVSFTLTSAIGVFEGSARVNCSDGELVLDLSDAEGLKVGEVTGLLGEGEGSGEYALLSGETGTWAY